MSVLNICRFSQADDKFWKTKYEHEAAKKARKAKRAARKEAAKKKGKKVTASDWLRLEDSSESEVALDSLGSFLTILLTLIIIRWTREQVMERMKR